jgi:hypothetical protein
MHWPLSWTTTTPTYTSVVGAIGEPPEHPSTANVVRIGAATLIETSWLSPGKGDNADHMNDQLGDRP